MKYSGVNVQTIKEEAGPNMIKEIKIFSYGHYEYGTFIVTETKKEVAFLFDTKKAIVEAIATANIEELHRLFNITSNRRLKKKIFYAVVAYSIA